MFACILIALLLAGFFVVRAHMSKPPETPQRGNDPAYSYDSPIPAGFEEYLRQSGSAEKLGEYEGRVDALIDVLFDKGERERAMFYAYGVDCERHGRIMGNIRKEANYPRYAQFADYVLSKDDLKRSLHERSTKEFWGPGHNTKIYRAAKEWFQ